VKNAIKYDEYKKVQYTPHMTVNLVISSQKYRVYTVYLWFWPTLGMLQLVFIVSLFQLPYILARATRK